MGRGCGEVVVEVVGGEVEGKAGKEERGKRKKKLKTRSEESRVEKIGLKK